MNARQFIEIDAPHLSIMEGEAEEALNDGMYGKALGEYLQRHLPERGYSVTAVFPEDWGWYVAAVRDDFPIDVCIYGYPKSDSIDETSELLPPPGTPLALCVHVGTQPRKYWNWRRFRFIDRTETVQQLNEQILALLESDPKITVIGCSDEFPL